MAPITWRISADIRQGLSVATGDAENFGPDVTPEIPDQVGDDTGESRLKDILPGILGQSSQLESDISDDIAFFNPETQEAVRLIKNQFRFLEQGGISIETYLYLNQETAHSLAEALDHIAFHFDNNYSLELYLYKDGEDGTRLIYANVRTSFPPDEALDRLEAFEENWFLDQMARTEGKLTFNLRYGF